MGKTHDHLGSDERLLILHWREIGVSLREIARRLGRSASTISREARRNGRPTRKGRGGDCPRRSDVHRTSDRRG